MKHPSVIPSLCRAGVWLLVCGCLTGQFLNLSSPVLAAESEDDEPTEKFTALTIDAVAAPIPAFRWRLYPAVHEMRRGDAASIYLRLAGERADFSRDKYANGSDEILALPFEKLQPSAIESLGDIRHDFEQLRIAALCDRCDWNYTFDQKGGYLEVRFSEMRAMRYFARVLAAKARCEIAGHDYVAAVETLRVGLVMARNISTANTLITQLVGVAIAGVMCDELQLLMAQPDAPNLYWALAALPRPFISLQQSQQMDRMYVYSALPELAQVDQPGVTVDWSRALSKLKSFMGEALGPGEGVNLAVLKELEQSGIPPEKVAAARRYLVETAGFASDKVEAMHQDEVVIRYSLAVFDYLLQENMKWASLPYWQAQPLRDANSERLETMSKEMEILPLASAIGSYGHVQWAEVRMQRQLATLQLIAALQDYAAHHGSSLPKQLADLPLPAPQDPVTGKAYEYALDDGVARVFGPAGLPGLTDASQFVRLHIRIRRTDNAHKNRY